MYCNKIYTRVANLNKHIIKCKVLLDYHKELLTIKRNIVIDFGETVDEISDHEIIKLLTITIEECSESEERIYISSGKLIQKYDELLTMSYPGNNNLIIPNPRSTFANAKYKDNWIKVSTEVSLEESFKERAERLFNRLENIYSIYENLSEIQISKDIRIELKQFSKNGFKHKGFVNGISNGYDYRIIKSNYKFNKLKKN